MPLRVLVRGWLRWLGCIVLLCVAAGCAAPGLAGQTPAWKTYSYAADGFSAAFPSEPVLGRKNIDTQAGTFELRSYLVEGEQMALFIGVCDYGDKAAGSDPKTLLQGAKKGALENSSSHLVSETPITLGIYPGLEFEAESSQMHFHARIYLVGATLYQTLVVSPLGKPYPPTVRFLDSFQLIARVRQ